MGISSRPTYVGYRDRIKEKYEKSGLHGRHYYEVLELALSYSIAHEIGHYMFGHYRDVFVDTNEISEERFEAFDTEHNKVQEQEANYFAGDLLMSSDMLKQNFDKIKNVEEISKIYNVSKEALRIRLLKLKLI